MAGKISAKKKYGQNFLIDKNVINNIIQSFTTYDNDLIVEVGPGKGALTKELKKKNANVVCFEIDTDLKEVLTNLEDEKTHVIFKDFLKVNLLDELQNLNYNDIYFVSNLPYYITTPILEHIIMEKINFKSLTIMVQKEVALRFMAKPGSKDYGYFSLFLQYFYNIIKICDVNKRCFNPVPKVDSMVIKLVPRNLNFVYFNNYNEFLKVAFSHKRKTLRNNIGDNQFALIKDLLQEKGFNESVRAEELGENDYFDIITFLNRSK